MKLERLKQKLVEKQYYSQQCNVSNYYTPTPAPGQTVTDQSALPSGCAAVGFGGYSQHDSQQ